ncbi:hypothetical protein VNO78_12511 [Psophocarpus tetragonolobus]|uniref:Uncharacterized protein n=1 Tax=Psophocarpus tetragonolobus TaxID=3891 RepID=A0AAN9SQW9_PSOTE
MHLQCDRHGARGTYLQRDAHLQADDRSDRHGARDTYIQRDAQQANDLDSDAQQMIDQSDGHRARDTHFERDAQQANGHRNQTVAFGPASSVGLQTEAQSEVPCRIQPDLSMGNRASSVGMQTEAQSEVPCEIQPDISKGNRANRARFYGSSETVLDIRSRARMEDVSAGK